MQRDHRAIERVLIVTFLLNLLATAAKLGAGLATGALSLIADGLDTLFDGLSNVVGLAAVRMGSQPPDEEHPYGHRKFETVAAIFIAMLFFLTAWELGAGAIRRLMDPPTLVVNGWSVAALIFGGGVQGFTGWWEMGRGRALQSEILVADARHTLTSLYVSMAVLLGLGLVHLGYVWADPLLTLVVAGFIVKIGVETLRENIPALVDRAPLSAGEIGDVVAGVEGVESFHRIRSRGPQDSVSVDLHVRVDPRLPVQHANAIADEVRRRLFTLSGVADVVVHLEAQRGPESAAELQQAVKLAAGELGIMIHEFWVQQDGEQVALHIHVGLDPNETLSHAHSLVDQFEQTVRQRRSEVNTIYTHIETAAGDILPSAQVSAGLQERVAQIVQDAAASIPSLSDPHSLQVRQVEGQLFVAICALVDGSLTVRDAHDLSTEMQERIRVRLPNAGEILVHLEPNLPEPANSANGGDPL
jgi:cation diffusion facilitator family transporter